MATRPMTTTPPPLAPGGNGTKVPAATTRTPTKNPERTRKPADQRGGQSSPRVLLRPRSRFLGRSSAFVFGSPTEEPTVVWVLWIGPA